MKITQKNLNEASGECIKFGVNQGKGISAYYADILRFLLHKEVHFEIFNSDSYQEYLSGEKLEKLGEYILNDLAEKYKLEKAMYKFQEIKFGKMNTIKEPFPGLLLGDELMLLMIRHKNYGNEDATILKSIFYTSDSVFIAFELLKDLQEKIVELIKEDENSDQTDIRYSLVFNSEDGYLESIKTARVDKIDISQFNEDLPENTIQEFIQNKESGILIFHGIPGCGKTSYIKHLIQTNKNVQFSYLGLDMIQQQDKLREYVICRQKKDIVIIVEDCEKLLQSRNYGTATTSLSDILNISDGILGDQTNTKFIFTFNSNLDSIDDAIIRRGRLKCMYEFKPLIGERLENLAEKLKIKLSDNEKTYGVALCDLYNYNKPEFKKPQRKIGFR
jgi:SpoVK/Ycf46/Vps4 family AAA+-type ATPase